VLGHFDTIRRNASRRRVLSGAVCFAQGAQIAFREFVAQDAALREHGETLIMTQSRNAAKVYVGRAPDYSAPRVQSRSGHAEYAACIGAIDCNATLSARPRRVALLTFLADFAKWPNRFFGNRSASTEDEDDQDGLWRRGARLVLQISRPFRRHSLLPHRSAI
jgi:hypothetical protein